MPVSKRLRYEIFRRDNHTCMYCGRSVPEVKLTVDHVVPQALGGPDDSSNLVAACFDCNNGKSSSAPDAPLVAQVAEDAMRWARAQHAAAEEMLAELGDRQAVRDQFAAKWNSWALRPGRSHRAEPLPVGWEQSVDQFMRAGLPAPILLDCVDKAMSTRNLKIENRFTYTCGIVWSRIRELRAQSALKVEANPRSVALENFGVTWESVLASTCSSQEEYEQQLARARDEAEDELTDEEAIRIAVENAVSDLSNDRVLLSLAVREILDNLPTDVVSKARESAQRRIREWEDELDTTFSEVELLRDTAWFVSSHLASEYLSALPDDERAEWLACAKTKLPDTADEQNVAFEAAKYARTIKAGGHPGWRMCISRGDHGAMCPGKVDSAVSFIDCPVPECSKAGACETHAFWCDRHIKEVDAGWTHYDGSAVKLAHVAEIPASWQVPF